MSTTIKTILRPALQKLDGSYTLFLRVTINRKCKYFSLNKSVHQKFWDEKKGRVKYGENNYLEINTTIFDAETRAENIKHDYEVIQRKTLTLDKFETLFNLDANSILTFENFVNQYIKTDLSLDKETVRFYKSQVSKLAKFKQTVYFQDIDVNFLTKYQNYMLHDIKPKPNKPITATKSLNFLKNIINKAIKKNILKENVFKDFTLHHYDGEREFLTIIEVEKLENLYYRIDIKDNEKRVLKYFLFTCYTGLRWGDIKDFKVKNIIDIDNDFFVYVPSMQKTQRPVKIPLIDKAKKIIDFDNINFNLSEMKLFDNYCSQVTNRLIKRCCKLANIDKSISLHCGRHTFATICINLGISIEVIQSMLGHTRLATTLIYSKLLDKTKTQQMDKWNTTL